MKDVFPAFSALGKIVSAALVCFVSACGPSELPPVMKGTSRQVVSAFLEKGHFEAPHYGAYSYILVPRPIESDARYGALLDAYKSLPPAPPDEARAKVLEQLNIVYVPVLALPGPASPAQWLAQAYDVTRAAMIAHTQGLTGVGPYIVTAKDPLSDESARVPLSVLDLSDAPQESMRLWVQLFVKHSQEPVSWAHEKAEYMALKLHDTLGNMYAGMKLTLEAIEPASKVLKVVGVSN